MFASFLLPRISSAPISNMLSKVQRNSSSDRPAASTQSFCHSINLFESIEIYNLCCLLTVHPLALERFIYILMSKLWVCCQPAHWAGVAMDNVCVCVSQAELLFSNLPQCYLDSLHCGAMESVDGKSSHAVYSLKPAVPS